MKIKLEEGFLDCFKKLEDPDLSAIDYILCLKYYNAINQSLKEHGDGHEMSALQCYWLSFVILGLLVTNSLCWSRFELFGLNEYDV